MTGLIILAIILILWGVIATLIAIIKPKKLWEIGKIQGFVKLMGDTATTIMILVLGVGAIVAGVLILV